MSGMNSRLIAESPCNRGCTLQRPERHASAIQPAWEDCRRLQTSTGLSICPLLEEELHSSGSSSSAQSLSWLKDRRELSRQQISADPRHWHFAFMGTDSFLTTKGTIAGRHGAVITCKYYEPAELPVIVDASSTFLKRCSIHYIQHEVSAEQFSLIIKALNILRL